MTSGSVGWNGRGLKNPETVYGKMRCFNARDNTKPVNAISIRLIKEIAPMVQEVHFMPLGWSDIVPEVIREIKQQIQVETRHALSLCGR